MEKVVEQALDWVRHYGYSAIVPALLLDPGGVPWPWVCLMAVAGGAGLNIVLMMALGMVLLTVCDHALYWVGIKGGRPLMRKWGVKWPGLAKAAAGAERAMRQRGLLAVLIGRFLPFVGRFVGLGAGLANMSYLSFTLLNLIGVGVTIVGFGLAAHFVGRKALENPQLQTLVGGTAIACFALTALFLAWQFWKSRRASVAPSSASTPASTSQP